jgi:hypothetical protein
MKVKQSFVNKKGYRIEKGAKFASAHRKIAYQKIYLRNRAKYPLPFERYDVHHINGNRQDNRPKNLELLTHEDHQMLHGIHPKVEYDEEK